MDGIANPNIPLSGEPPDTLWTLLRLKFAVAEDFEAARNAQSSAHAPNGFFFDPSNATNIGSSRLEFDIVQENFAWIADNKQEKKMIKTMKKGSRIMITGYNQEGSQTIDHYSLLGFTKAYGAAKKSCS